jgi:hypothetical protein
MKIDFKLIQKSKHIIVALFFMNTGIYVFAQKSSLPPEAIDSAYWGIKKNTYRINLSFPLLTVGDIPEGTGILAGMYEWALKRNFSIVSKIGMNTYNNPYERILTKYSYHALASIEQRYYFNFKRRIRKAKPILNNSGTYFGFEGRYLTTLYKNPNDDSFNTPTDGIKVFYNIGHQIQNNKYFLNYHFGFEFPFQSVTSGIGIGLVF